MVVVAVVVVAVVVVTIAAIAVGPVTVALELATVMLATVMLVTDVPGRVVGAVAGLSHRGYGESRDGSQSHHCLGQS